MEVVCDWQGVINGLSALVWLFAAFGFFLLLAALSGGIR